MLDSLVTTRRDKTAALKFLRKSIRRLGAEEAIVSAPLAQRRPLGAA